MTVEHPFNKIVEGIGFLIFVNSTQKFLRFLALSN